MGSIQSDLDLLGGLVLELEAAAAEGQGLTVIRCDRLAKVLRKVLTFGFPGTEADRRHDHPPKSRQARVEEDEVMLNCPICDKSFHDPDRLFAHARAVHMQELLELITGMRKPYATLRAKLLAETARADAAEAALKCLEFKRSGLAELPVLIMSNIEDVAGWRDDHALITARAHAYVLHHDLPPVFEAESRLHALSEAAAMALVVLGQIAADFEDFPKPEHAEKLGDLAWYSMAVEQQSMARTAHQALTSALSDQSNEKRT